jgi:hypothetical protein
VFYRILSLQLVQLIQFSGGKVTITNFLDYYNYRRYHKALDNAPPDDVLQERDAILASRKEVKTQTLRSRQLHN